MVKNTFNGYNRIKFQSSKLEKTVFCQSLLLRDYLIHLEWDDSVISSQLKPFKIICKINDVRRTFYPHLLVEKSEKQNVIIWLNSLPQDEKTDKMLIKQITNICNSKDYFFESITADHVRKDPFFSNLKLLRRFHRYEISVQEIFLCSEFFEKFSTPVFGDLIEFLSLRGKSPEATFALLHQKVIFSDLDSQHINKDMLIVQRNPFPNFLNGRINNELK